MFGFEDRTRLDEPGPDDRWSGRVPIEGLLGCLPGRVLDLSMGGIRIRTRRSHRGAVVLVRIWDEQGGIETEATVVWRKRLGFFRHELGLAFPPLDDASRTVLQRLAGDHRFRLCMKDLQEYRAAA